MAAAPPRINRASALVPAVIAGALSAGIYAIALSSDHADSPLIFLVYLTNIPVFMAGLGGGALAALVTALAASIGLYVFEPSNFAFVYAFVFAVPGIVLTALALRYRTGQQDQKVYWYPEGNMLVAAAFYPALVLILVSVFLSSTEGGILAILTSAFNTITDHVSKNVGADRAADVHQFMDNMLAMAPGLVGVTWIIVMMIDMVFAQVILRQQKLNLRETFTLRDIHLPAFLIFALAIFGMAALVSSFTTWVTFAYVCKNVCIMLGLPYFFTGLSVIHAWAGSTRAPTIILVVFYVVLAVLMWLGVLVVLLGVVDQWLDFRKILAKAKKTPT